jgi:CDGSH-type Zn-finger protein
MATIKVRQNGSLLVEGDDVRLIDWNGNEYALPKRPFALCRCGASSKKPFCDASHKTIGFSACEAADGTASGDAPATATPPTPGTPTPGVS